MRNIVDRGRGLAVHDHQGIRCLVGEASIQGRHESPPISYLQTPEKSGRERCFDLLRGAAVLTGNDLLLRLARTVSRFPEPNFTSLSTTARSPRKCGRAMNSRNTRRKGWQRLWIVGGWYGVLPALLFADDRLSIGRIESIDIDPAVAVVARSLNEPQVADGRFAARTADMYALDYAAASGGPDLVINTSCEHIADLPGWLALIPRGTRVLLQSNDYFAESQHVNSHASLDEFAAIAGLAPGRFRGLALPAKIYPLHADRPRLTRSRSQQDFGGMPRSVEIEPMPGRRGSAACAASIAAIQLRRHRARLRQRRARASGRAKFLSPQALLGFAAGGERHEDAAAAGAQYVADGIVARLADGNSGPGEIMPADRAGIARASHGAAWRPHRAKLGPVMMHQGACCARQLLPGLKRGGDQSSSGSAASGRHKHCMALGRQAGFRPGNKPGIGDPAGDFAGARKSFLEPCETRIAMDQNMIEPAVQRIDRLFGTAGLLVFLQDVADRRDDQWSWARAPRLLPRKRVFPCASAGDRRGRPR